MTLIRARVLLLSAFALSITSAFGFLTYSSFQNYSKLNSQLEESYGFIDAILLHQKRQLSSDRRADIEKRLPSIQPEFRAKALKDAFTNPNSETVSVSLRQESEYRKYLAPLIDYFNQRVHYFGGISLGVAFLFSLVSAFLILRMVFVPLKDLSEKMVDFLNNKYSYQFTIPENHEIGRLHATFNAMAQKVLLQIEDLKALDKAKSEFLSIASHELRTPLTSIKGSLGLLNSGVVGKMNEASINLMTIALNETDRLIRIINELLDLAKIEAKQFPLNMEWAWADDLVNKTLASLQGFCQQAGVKLEHGDMKNLELYMDGDRIQQVLMNLLSNAIKFSPKGKSVRVECVEDENHMMRVEVIDQGRGIAPEDQELIFEKFRQATSAQNPLVKGTGLGLAIAKALVEQHGGVIGVRSIPGEGSTFYFTLPKWRLHVQETKAS